ncbi:MAG: hypothetical protein R2991_08320 [Thermoanaerobaculia bacterium]
MSDLPRRRAVSLLAALALLASAAAAELAELSPERRARLEELVGEVERLRGLEAPERFEVRVVDADGLAEEVEALMVRDLPAEDLRAAGRALELFGLLPPGFDLADVLRRLLGDQIAGFFDPDRELLVLVDGLDVPGLEERTVMVHELTHLVQHAHFDLRKMLTDDPLSDRDAAVQAMVEGDATLVMVEDLLGDAAQGGPWLDLLTGDAAGLAGSAAGLDPDLAGYPRYLRESLIFPYVQGLRFCAAVREAGGQELLDRAFGVSPPSSSEQILHPEKWLAGSDPPIEIELPELDALLARRLRAQGSLGENDLRILLAERLPGADPESVGAAAQGWGGDRFALYGDEPGDVLVWITEWDTEEDAAEFATLAFEAFPEPAAVRTSPTRVVVVLGGPPEDPELLVSVLAAARAQKKTRSIDQ